MLPTYEASTSQFARQLILEARRILLRVGQRPVQILRT